MCLFQAPFKSVSYHKHTDEDVKIKCRQCSNYRIAVIQPRQRSIYLWSMENAQQKPSVLTGIKPTGRPHLGNYLGSIRPALELAHTHEAFYFIADAHALTTVKDPERLDDLVCQVAATWISLGLDPEKITFYRQSDVPETFTLAWILSCFSAKGLLNRAHAYKAATAKNLSEGRDNDADVNVGLYSYPILMAADILLMAAENVPVGRDQQQHLEMTRDIAAAFNNIYGRVLTLPAPLARSAVETITGLDGRKMSKSYNNTIPVLCEPDELRRLVMRIVTDSRRPEASKDPEQCNVFALYRHFAPVGEVARMKARYLEGGLAYKTVKEELFDILDMRFSEARTRFAGLMAERPSLKKILKKGGIKARDRARHTLNAVRRAVGFSSPRA